MATKHRSKLTFKTTILSAICMNNTPGERDKWFNSNHLSIGNKLKTILNCTKNNIFKTLFKNLFENDFASGAWNAVNVNQFFINFHILHFIINRNKKGEKKNPFLIVKWSYCTSPLYMFPFRIPVLFIAFKSTTMIMIDIQTSNQKVWTQYTAPLEQQKRLCKMWTRDIIYAPLHLIHLLVSPILLNYAAHIRKW